MEEWPDFHSQGKVIYIPDLDKYKEGSAKEVLKSQKIKSLIAVPLLDEDRCIGFTGFDSVKILITNTMKTNKICSGYLPRYL